MVLSVNTFLHVFVYVWYNISTYVSASCTLGNCHLQVFIKINSHRIKMEYAVETSTLSCYNYNTDSIYVMLCYVPSVSRIITCSQVPRLLLSVRNEELNSGNSSQDYTRYIQQCQFLTLPTTLPLMMYLHYRDTYQRLLRGLCCLTCLRLSSRSKPRNSPQNLCL